MKTVTLTLTRQQTEYLAASLAQGIAGNIYPPPPDRETPSIVLEAWRKERVLWKKDPFRARGNVPHTKKEARESEAERQLVDFESRILARFIAALPAQEGGAR